MKRQNENLDMYKIAACLYSNIIPEVSKLYKGDNSKLRDSAIDYNIQIICIQEHKYLHSEDIKYHDTGNGWTFVSASTWKNSINAAIKDVGMLIGPRALKALNSNKKIQPMMMVATFNGNASTTIISCYSPTNVSEETNLVTCNELSSFSSSVETWMPK